MHYTRRGRHAQQPRAATAGRARRRGPDGRPHGHAKLWNHTAFAGRGDGAKKFFGFAKFKLSKS